MRSLLRKIDTEIFVLDLEQPLNLLPQNIGLSIRLLDEYTVEVEIDRNQNLNFIYEQLSKNNIHVRSMRNKANRLEQLFIHLVGQSKDRGVPIE